MTKRTAGVDGYAAIEDSNTLQVDEDDLIIFPGELGSGSQGVIKKAYHRSFGNVAYKKLQDLISNTQYRSMCEQRELKFTNQVRFSSWISTFQVDNNPYILKFLAYVIKKNPDGSKLVVGMLLEYMAQGNVSNVLFSRPEMITMNRVRKWILQLARALLHCHDIHNVVHRDVKVENALLGDNYNHLKLCDFGFARNVDPGKMTGNNPKSIHSAAPETIGDNPYADYSYPCDVYSFGMFIYTVLDQMFPFMEIRSNKLQSIKVKYKTLSSPSSTDLSVILPSDRPTSLLSNKYLLAGYLKKHDDDAEDEFRPPIKREKWREFFCRDPFFAEQFATDLEILIWLMKECWRTNAEKRPKMSKIVDILDFHFEPPIDLSWSNDTFYLVNISYYKVAFRILSVERKHHKINVNCGILCSGDSIDLKLEVLSKEVPYEDIRLLIEYIQIDEKAIGPMSERILADETAMLELQSDWTAEKFRAKCWQNKKHSDGEFYFNFTTEEDRSGKNPSKVGSVTLGVKKRVQTEIESTVAAIACPVKVE